MRENVREAQPLHNMIITRCSSSWCYVTQQQQLFGSYYLVVSVLPFDNLIFGLDNSNNNKTNNTTTTTTSASTISTVVMCSSLSVWWSSSLFIRNNNNTNNYVLSFDNSLWSLQTTICYRSLLVSVWYYLNSHNNNNNNNNNKVSIHKLEMVRFMYY